MPRDISGAEGKADVAAGDGVSAHEAAIKFINDFALTRQLSAAARKSLQGMIDLSRRGNNLFTEPEREIYREQYMHQLRRLLGKGVHLAELDRNLRALEQPFTLPRPLPRWLTR